MSGIKQMDFVPLIGQRKCKYFTSCVANTSMCCPEIRFTEGPLSRRNRGLLKMDWLRAKNGFREFPVTDVSLPSRPQRDFPMKPVNRHCTNGRIEEGDRN